MKHRAAYAVSDPWEGSAHFFADHVHEQERNTQSSLLGPDGRPLNYEPRQPLGFDLKGAKRDKPSSNTSKG